MGGICCNMSSFYSDHCSLECNADGTVSAVLQGGSVFWLLRHGLDKKLYVIVKSLRCVQLHVNGTFHISRMRSVRHHLRGILLLTSLRNGDTQTQALCNANWNAMEHNYKCNSQARSRVSVSQTNIMILKSWMLLYMYMYACIYVICCLQVNCSYLACERVRKISRWTELKCFASTNCRRVHYCFHRQEMVCDFIAATIKYGGLGLDLLWLQADISSCWPHSR